MLGLVVAGEAIFGLPFHVARFFRPTFLAVFELSNTELGTAQAVYGVVAMAAYFAGGPIADRFPARKLLVASLVGTAVGGLYMASVPGYWGMVTLWGAFGLTTILLFWAALIRATREWGGERSQGLAYGLLDGGRGLLAALMASAAVYVFTVVFPEDGSAVTPQERAGVLRLVIYGYTAVTLAAAAWVWFAVPEPHAQTVTTERPAHPLIERILTVLEIPSVWLQALIVVCAYVGFKGFDDYSLYAAEGFGMNEVEAAKIATLGAWVRPVAAVGAGYLGDRLRSSRVIIVLFGVLLASDLYFALVPPTPSAPGVLLTNVLVASVAVFGFRGLYFALFQEARVPMAVTGTAVGIVSVLGYTPDVFVSLVGGILLDRSPGIAGHQHFFWFLAGFAGLGLLAAMVFERLNRRDASRTSTAH
jgi:nitrate/nitrite transporter NarK